MTDTDTDIAATSATSSNTITNAAAVPPVSKSGSSSNLREVSTSPVAAAAAAAAAAAVTPTISGDTSSNNKENSANAAVTVPTLGESLASSPPALKRPASPDTDGTKPKRTKRNANQDSDNPEDGPLDLAVTFGYKPGDRIQVHWEVEYDGKVVTKWWGASLLPFDGRTTDSVAIRTLHYDACPELGFDEGNDDDVVFFGPDLLISPDPDSKTQLQYRKEGAGEEEEVFWLSENDMEDQLNTILTGALAKNQAAWQNIPAAQQAVIAETIRVKKEALLKVLRSKKDVITASSIKDIMQEAFGK